MKIESLTSELTFEEWCEANNIELTAKERPLELQKSLNINKWYVSGREKGTGKSVEISDGYCLRGGAGNGDSPEEAMYDLADYWRGQRLVIDAFGSRREIQVPNEWEDA